jgi:hypothetical protein
LKYETEAKFTNGDLVYLNNFGSRTWIVNYHKHEEYPMYDEMVEVVVYDVTCVVSMERRRAIQEDVMLVCKADYAYLYLGQLDTNGMPPRLDAVSKSSYRKEDTQLKKRKEKDDLINNLLDMYNDIQRFIESDGEISEHFQAKMDEIKAKWTSLTAKENEN